VAAGGWCGAGDTGPVRVDQRGWEERSVTTAERVPTREECYEVVLRLMAQALVRRAAERARLARYDAATLLAAEDARDEGLQDERVSA